jgi:DNA-binding MarR family transcriptional regulator
MSGSRIRPPSPPAADLGEVKPFTAKQGQYLAFIYYYTKIHGTPPAESDFRRFFRVTPPVVHQMIMTLEARGFIDREPRTARSIRLRLTRTQLPDLE